ncbi:MAG: TetR/AcrR family transcriptional regulator [Planctomycetota bacterium]
MKANKSRVQTTAVGSVNQRDRQKRETRERIVAAATKLLLREGPDAFSMRKLASQIGYTATAIYFHFPDREALLSEVVDRQFLKFRSSFEQAVAIADPIERLRAMGLAFVQFAVEHPALYHKLFLIPLDNIPKGRLVEKGNPSQDCYALLHSTVIEGLHQNRFLPQHRNSQLIAQVFFAGVHGLAALHLVKGNDDWFEWTDLSERAQVMVDGLINGLCGHSEALANTTATKPKRSPQPRPTKSPNAKNKPAKTTTDSSKSARRRR